MFAPTLPPPAPAESALPHALDADATWPPEETPTDPAMVLDLVLDDDDLDAQ